MRNRRITQIALLALVAGLLSGGSALAAGDCTFDANGDMVVSPDPTGQPTALQAESDGAITVDQQVCGDVNGVDKIRIEDEQELGGLNVTISLGNGGFGPGATVEASGESEIELEVELPTGPRGQSTLTIFGDNGPDTVHLGSSGGAFNEDGDGDMSVLDPGVRLIVVGGLGNDSITAAGGAGSGSAKAQAVILQGGPGDDSITGGNGDDLLEGNAGADAIAGGGGSDVATYAGSPLAVNVDLATQTASGGSADGDTLGSIEGVVGSGFDDSLSGDAGPNLLAGGNGDDSITGGAGGDDIDGGSGRDHIDYSASVAGIVVDLHSGSASGGDAQGDSLTAMEDVTGTSSDDDISGSNLVNVIDAGAGDDTVEGSLGADTLMGADGLDTLSYKTSDLGVIVDLGSGTASGGDANGDVYSGFEDLEGSSHIDELTGDDGANSIDAGAGDDSIDGGGGDDVIDGESGRDIENGGDGNDLFRQGAEQDGGDRILGGPGTDEVLYDLRADDLVLTLDGLANDGSIGEADNIGKDIERVATGSGADDVTGSTSGNLIRGNGGKDRLRGMKGKDKLKGGNGNDYLDGGGDRDTMDGGPGKDTCVMDRRSDRVRNCERIRRHYRRHYDPVPPTIPAPL